MVRIEVNVLLVSRVVALAALFLLLPGCATGQGGSSEAGQLLSGVLMGIGQGLSGL